MSSQEFDWQQLFAPGESPYFAMFRCGVIGIPVEDLIAHCTQQGIPLREKDIRSWTDGHWNHQIRTNRSVLNPVIKPPHLTSISVLDAKLTDFSTWPPGWTGTDRRWFPCDEQNMPMQKWGFSDGYIPTLYTREQAQAMSPIGWVGQNLYAQPMVVFDIDGVGHGVRDEQVIEFGNRFRNLTETWESPDKPGSFHLYFKTDRQIPISHFPYAKLDLMGNQKNAAVYTKSKVSNGIPAADLDEEIWAELKLYLHHRREERERRRT